MAEPGYSAAESAGVPGAAAPKRSWPILLLKLAISVGLLAFLVRQTSWDRLAARLNDAAIANVLLALSPLAIVTICVAYRWQVIANALVRPIRLIDAWVVCMIGSALDQVLVTMSGDAYRIWWLKKDAASLSSVVATVLLDRVAGVLGVVFLVFATLPLLVNVSVQQAGWVPAGLAAAILCGFAMLLLLDRAPVEFSRNRWLAGLETLSSGARRVFLLPATAIPVLLAAVSAHAIIAACIAFLGWALGIDLSLATALTVVPTAMLVSMLPISIGGWGVREGAMVLALGLAGIESADALLISVTYGLGAAACGLSGWILWLSGLPSHPPGPGGR